MGYIIAFIIGAIIGVGITCLCVAAGESGNE